VVRADVELRVDGAAAPFAFAEHDVGAHREPLVELVRVRELGIVKSACHVVAEQEIGIARLVAEHVRRVQLGRHEARRLHDRRNERLRGIRQIGVNARGCPIDVVVLTEVRCGRELELADALVARRRVSLEPARDGAPLRPDHELRCRRTLREPTEIAVVGAVGCRVESNGRSGTVAGRAQRQTAVVTRECREPGFRRCQRKLVGRVAEIAELVVHDAQVVMQQRRVDAASSCLAIAQQSRPVDSGAHQRIALGR
jgi:hypothetical protein